MKSNKRPKPAPQTDDTYTVVNRIINEADPESALQFGAPEDEYTTTCLAIATAIDDEGGKCKLSSTEVANIIALAFHLKFDRWSKPLVLHVSHFDLAKKILAEL